MIKKLAKYIGEYKKESILAPVYITLEVAAEVIIPVLMALIIDVGIVNNDTGFIIRIGSIMVVLAFAAMLFGVLSGKYAARASAGFAKNLRRGLFYHVQDFSFHNMDKFPSSSLITRLTTDVSTLQNTYQMIVRILVHSPAMFFLSLIMAMTVNFTLSMMFLAIVPFSAIGIYFIISKAYPIFRKVFKIFDKMNIVVQENVRAVRVVKSYVREDHETEKFKAVSGELNANYMKAEKIVAFIAPLTRISVAGAILGIAWFGAHMIVSETLTKGELLILIAYTGQIMMSLVSVAMILVMITASRASAERIIEVLDEQSDLRNCENPVKNISDGSIEFKDVSFSYSKEGSPLCLKNANISIKSGETVGIIGGTGSSKTSLVQLIPRLYDTTSGSVYVSGVDVRKLDIKTLRDEVSMVLQKNVLFSGTVKDNLRWGAKNASDEELQQACELAQADSFIQEMSDGYDTKITQDGTNLSGGQRQRICIARALLKKPKILILDDSTSAVDTATDSLIRNGLKNYLPDTTKLIIAQRVDSIRDADKIIVMDNAHIVGMGTHDELLKENAIYQEVYYSQTQSGGGTIDEA